MADPQRETLHRQLRYFTSVCFIPFFSLFIIQWDWTLPVIDFLPNPHVAIDITPLNGLGCIYCAYYNVERSFNAAEALFPNEWEETEVELEIYRLIL